MIAGLVGLHLWALHLVGQNSPIGLDVKTPSDAVPMHPYATSKDAVGMFAFMILFAWFVFFLPDYLGHADNYTPANPLVDAAAHRAGVVLPALLRDPARDPVQAVRRHRHVLLDRGAVLRAVARYEPRALDQVPADLSLVLLAVRVHLRGARLSRLASRRTRSTCSGRGSSRPTISRTSFSSCRSSAWLEKPRPLPGSITEAVLGKNAAPHPHPPRRQRSKGASMSRADLACRFAAVLLFGLVSLAGATAVKAEDAGEEHATERQSWPFAGLRGQYDQAQLQRGFQIYQNVCCGLPRPQARALPQSRRAGRSAVPRGLRQGAGHRLAQQDLGRARRRRATPSTGFRASPIRSSAPTRTTSRRARPRTARCRPISRSSPRRARWKALRPGTRTGSGCWSTSRAATRKVAPTTSTTCSPATPIRRPACRSRTACTTT